MTRSARPVRSTRSTRSADPARPAHPAGPPHRRDAARPEGGQATAEYALVLLGAAAIALLLLAWATDTGAVGRLLDAVLESILERV